MSSRELSVLAVLVMAFAGCASSGPSKRAVTEPVETEYRIGREDVLEVVVWREPDLSRVVPVRPDGRISLPLAGEVEAAGRTPAELQASLAKTYAGWIQDATVAVVVREVNGPRVYVLGEVARPGGFPLRGPLTVVQAIALAGGRTEFASRNLQLLRSKPDGSTERTEVAFDELVKGEGKGGLWLRSGDVLYVP